MYILLFWGLNPDSFHSFFLSLKINRRNGFANCKYILNFSVSGEFNLEVFYVPEGDGKPVWLLGKSFCCK